MYRVHLLLKILLALTIALKGLNACAQVHLNAHDKSIRYDLAKPEHSPA